MARQERYSLDFQGEKGSGGGGRNLNTLETPGDMKRKQEVQDGREVMPHDRT